VFDDIRETELHYKSWLKDQVETKDRQIGVVNAIAALSGSPGWREFTAKLALLKEASVAQLVSEQESHQKFRVSGRVEAFTMLVAAVEDAASEAKRLSAEREELVEWAGQRLSEDLRLNPAGGIWKDGEAHGGSRGRQG
jgi:hypothetical protein